MQESDHEHAMTAVQLQRPYLASYCMIQANDAILVQRRFNTGYLDGHWALPSGHAIDGEDALAAASRELLEETSLIVKSDDWQFVCAMHRLTDRTIIDLFFTADKFVGTPRICEPAKCDGLAFFPMNALPNPWRAISVWHSIASKGSALAMAPTTARAGREPPPARLAPNNILLGGRLDLVHRFDWRRAFGRMFRPN
jgi:8-oxo-dGTP diphosphatase